MHVTENETWQKQERGKRRQQGSTSGCHSYHSYVHSHIWFLERAHVQLLLTPAHRVSESIFSMSKQQQKRHLIVFIHQPLWPCIYSQHWICSHQGFQASKGRAWWPPVALSCKMDGGLSKSCDRTPCLACVRISAYPIISSYAES